MTAAGVPAAGYAAALAALPGIGPAGLLSLMREHGPEEGWARVVAGEVRRPEPPPGRPPAGRRVSWSAAAATVDPAALALGLAAAGIGITFIGEADFPPSLSADPQPPAVLFWAGDLDALRRPCVAIVGTRHCTSYGRAVATELGRDLAGAGVCVVSGLALGIDGAAHAGALAARPAGAGPVGVTASGVDRPYPRRHARLWAEVAGAGAVVSEVPAGQPAQAWRFPARNRLIAGLSRAVVVVESHAGGGSMLTVAAAADRGIDILAVPGPVTSPSSVGTNQLLYEGLSPARHAGDVLAALGDLRPWPPPAPDPWAAGPAPGALDPPSRRGLESVDWTPTATSVIGDRTGLPLGPLSAVLMRLEARGLVHGDGSWWERSRP